VDIDLIQSLPICLLSESKYFQALFEYLDCDHETVVDLVWSLLKILPSNSALRQSLLALTDFPIVEYLSLEHLHRSIYFLQLVLNILEESAISEEARLWKDRFEQLGLPNLFLDALFAMEITSASMNSKWSIKRILFLLHVFKMLTKPVWVQMQPDSEQVLSFCRLFFSSSFAEIVSSDIIHREVNAYLSVRSVAFKNLTRGFYPSQTTCCLQCLHCVRRRRIFERHCIEYFRSVSCCLSC
jgi:hypothetical protein